MNKLIKSPGLSGNALKLIAALSMLCDHVGLMFFPKVAVFRIVGRLAFPIFAFMIAEGCRYTHSRRRYFLGIFILATLCQVVYFIAMRSVDLSILVSFSLSILVIYALQDLKKSIFSGKAAGSERLLRAALLIAAVAGVYVISRLCVLDYGFWGCMCPVFAAALHPWDEAPPAFTQNRRIHVLMMCIPLLFLSLQLKWVQPFCFAAIPLLLLYGGQRGKLRLKYFFYIFYPAHLVILQGIRFLVQ